MHARSCSLPSILHNLPATCSLSNLFTTAGMIGPDSPSPVPPAGHAIYFAFLYDMHWLLTSHL
ncbi:MAG: hypothetical protein ACI9ZF_003074 [Bradyrhizobium sp.]|jgi:hypothetical protein